MENLPDDIHMLSQPLTTEEGFLNEACMNELAAAINNMPETWERLANDPEWSERQWIFSSTISGYLVNTAVRFYRKCPPNLVQIVDYVATCLYRDFEKRENSKDRNDIMCQLSLCEINKMLWDILGDLSLFQEWNIKETMGEDWLDLSAVLHNVCLDIRREWRENKLFDEKFKCKHGKLVAGKFDED